MFSVCKVSSGYVAINYTVLLLVVLAILVSKVNCLISLSTSSKSRVLIYAS